MSHIFFAAPPISRTLAASTFTLSLLVQSYLIPFQNVNLNLQAAFLKLPPQIWRLFTALLITGPHMWLLFDTYFLYVYGAKLETASPRFSQRADFFTYILFVYFVILILNGFITGGTIFASALALSFVCTSTISDWGQPIIFTIIKMPAQYLPYAILLLTLILLSPTDALVQATGLVAAHLYDFLTGMYPKFGGPSRNLLPTPRFLDRIFGARLVTERPYGTAFQPAQRVPGEPAWGLEWGRFGKGHRLGGEGESTVRQRPRGCVLAGLVMMGFVVIGCTLGFFFVLRGDTEGWLATLRPGVDVGKLSSGTAPFKGRESVVSFGQDSAKIAAASA